MKIPHPGELRHLVEIGRTVNAVNENGYPVETDQTICRVWAAAEDDSSRYFFSADAENAGRGLAFIIRWRADVERIARNHRVGAEEIGRIRKGPIVGYLDAA